jgi:hypothetical protein
MIHKTFRLSAALAGMVMLSVALSSNAQAQTTDDSKKITATAAANNAKDGKAQKMDAKEQMAARASAGEVRDWNQIDLNKDNLVTPEEMENYLNKVWAAKKK